MKFGNLVKITLVGLVLSCSVGATPLTRMKPKYGEDKDVLNCHKIDNFLMAQDAWVISD